MEKQVIKRNRGHWAALLGSVEELESVKVMFCNELCVYVPLHRRTLEILALLGVVFARTRRLQVLC